MDYFEEIRFSISAYSAETMPLPRLLEYLKELTLVVGEGASDGMHLLRVESSSTRPIFRVLPEIARLAREQAVAVRTGRGTVKQRAAYNRVRRMVRQDGGRPASLVDRTGVLLDFAPAAEEAEIVASVRQPTVFDGTLTRLGGVDETSTILMQNFEGEVCAGFAAPKSIAKEMGRFLFDPLRLTGIGRWDRHRNGRWQLSSMLIQAYEPISDESLLETLRRLREVRVVWPADFDNKLLRERETAL